MAASGGARSAMTIPYIQPESHYRASHRIRHSGSAPDRCIRQHQPLPLRALWHAAGDRGYRPVARPSRPMPRVRSLQRSGYLIARVEGHMGNGLGDAPEVKQALAKAEECAKKAALAKTAKDREYYDRMHRKWLGIADGWRLIDEIAEAS
jgi:hypothetical protein